MTAYVLSALGGVFYFVGWAGFGVWPLELVCFVPLWAALELVRGRSWKLSFALGWLFGTVAMAGGYHWMIEFSERFSGFSLPANLGLFVGFSMYLGLQYAVQGLLYWAIRARGWSLGIAAVPPLIVTEWLFPKWFPVYMGNTLVAEPLLVQVVDLGGPLLASAVVAVVNLAVFEAIRWWQGARGLPVAPLGVAVAFVGLAIVYGAVRIAAVNDDVAASPSFVVGLVQANRGVRGNVQELYAGNEQHLDQSEELEAQGALHLLVWPESSFYPWFARTLPLTAREVRGELESPLLFGGTSYAPATGFEELYNSALLVDEQGIVGQMYDKTRLAMFGEYLPLGDTFPVLYELLPNSHRSTPGTHLLPLRLGPWRISTPICYEDVLPGLVREMVREANPHLLVNLTNDAWFGDTQEPWIHFRLAQLRAIEHRRYLVRATNSGVSGVVDPAGRIVARTGIDTRENLRAQVHMMEGQTVYARLGDWPGWLSLFVTGFALVRKKRMPA